MHFEQKMYFNINTYVLRNGNSLRLRSKGEKIMNTSVIRNTLNELHGLALFSILCFPSD